jgi:hypothetical protein
MTFVSVQILPIIALGQNLPLTLPVTVGIYFVMRSTQLFTLHVQPDSHLKALVLVYTLPQDSCDRSSNAAVAVQGWVSRYSSEASCAQQWTRGPSQPTQPHLLLLG